MRQRVMNLTAAAMLLVGSLLGATAATAQPWKSDKPVRIIVPWGPGGVIDVTARSIATAMAARFNHPFIVENKPGASGMIGTAFVASSPPDGYTFLLGNVDTQVLDPLLFPSTVRYDVEKHFDPLMELGRVPMALVSRQSLNAQNAQDFVRLAKDKPGSMSYGTWGVGSTAHLAFLLLEQQTGLDLNHLPYNGAPPVYTALLGGHIDFAVTQLPWALNSAKEGKVRILGITNATRSSLAPSVPTMAEAGFKDYVVELWMGLYAPKGTPSEIRDPLTREIALWLETPEARAVLQAAGAEPQSGTSAQLRARQQSETAFWQRLIKAKNISLDAK